MILASAKNFVNLFAKIKKIFGDRYFRGGFNVIIKIPANSSSVKFENDNGLGAAFIDGTMSADMFYPMSYGYIPHTLSEDGDPVGVWVNTPFPLAPGVVIRCRSIGLLEIEDEYGNTAKVLAVPVKEMAALEDNVITYHDMSKQLLNQVVNFFDHYKDLEQGKWVKVVRWKGVEAANDIILCGVATSCLRGIL